MLPELGKYGMDVFHGVYIYTMLQIYCTGGNGPEHLYQHERERKHHTIEMIKFLIANGISLRMGQKVYDI